MNPPSPGSLSPSTEIFLSGAYRRILKTAIVLALASVVATIVFFGKATAAGVGMGAALALLNFVWLHQGAELMVRRMVPLKAGEAPPSKLRLLLAFAARYVLVLSAAYVILNRYPHVIIGFLVGLASPIAAAMGEGLFEAVVSSK